MKYLKKFNESKTVIEIDRDSINNLENSINRSLRSLGDFIYGQQMNLIIGYNDVNHAEIDNILSEYGIVADEIWGVPI
jgi:hypothetical protein